MSPRTLAIVTSLAALGLIGAVAAQEARRRPEAAPNPLLRVLDGDGDGRLSEAEIAGAPATLKALDADGDGTLAADEIPGRDRGGRDGGRPGRGAPEAAGASPEKPTVAKDDGEARILKALQEARRGQRFANVSDADGRLLRILTEAVDAKRVVELGTSTGESGLWFCLALRKTGGHLDTHDIDPGRIAVARENFRNGGVEDLVTIVEGDAHETAPRKDEPIDVLFIDAEKPGYADYLGELLPKVRPGGLVIAHNMRRPAPDPRYIEAITTDPNLDTSFLLMDGAGVGVTLKKR